jgi:cobalamin biosynthesis protein CobT
MAKKGSDNAVAKAMAEGYMPAGTFMDATSAAARTFSRDGKLRVVFQGEVAATDGDTIYLPALDQTKTLTKAQVMIGRGYCDHEAGHNRHTDMPAYKAAVRAAEERGDKLFPHILNALEDVRIEKRIIADYVGSRENLAAVHHAVNHEFLTEHLPKQPEAVEDWRIIAPAAITWEGFQRAGYDEFTLDGYTPRSHAECKAKLPADLQRKVELWIDALEGCRNTKDVIDLAERLCKEVHEHEREKRSGGGGGEGGGKSGSDGAEAGKRERPDTYTVEAPDGTMTKAPDTTSSTGGVGAGPEKVDRVYDPDREAPPTPIGTELNIKRVFGDASTSIEAGYRPWSTSHDKIHTRHDGPGKYVGVDKRGRPDYSNNFSYGHRLSRPSGDSMYRRALENAQGSTNQMRRKLERALMAKLRADWRGGHEYGRLDTKRLVPAYNGESNVYRMKEEAPALDTALSILIDLSGSMSGSPAYLAMQATICLAEVLEKVNVPFEVLGFNNSSGFLDEASAKQYQRDINDGKKYSRWEPLDIYVFKDFNESLREARRAMGHITACAGGNNSDGDAVLVAHRRLMKRREARKILLVMSDGYPAHMSSFGRQHIYNWLRNVVDYVELTGVKLIGIGIMSDAVSQFYPRYQVLNSLAELPKGVLDNIARMLLGERFRVDNKDLLSADRAVSKALGRR